MTRFTRLTPGYSKDLRMHKLAVHLHFGIYNLCRKHKGLDRQRRLRGRGGKREGAGRPPEGKERFTVTLKAENVTRVELR
jgi:hypothetical protein